MPPKSRRIERRHYGIGEWYGRLFTSLTVAERKEFGAIGGKKGHGLPCIPRSALGSAITCSKAGGVCSLGAYTMNPDGVAFERESLVTLCPYRFWEDGRIFHSVSKHVLKQESPVLIVKEVGFLQGVAPTGQDESGMIGVASEEGLVAGGPDVGRIDMVLVRPESDPLAWCALEMQAVYFSGGSMSLKAI